MRGEVFVALGSNLGESASILGQAMNRLEALSVAPLRRSSIWRSVPVDCPPGSPGFLNAVVGMSPFDAETPETLLERLRELEREFGRRPKQVRNEARPLDLDLLVFGSARRQTPGLILPHPRIAERGFVLAPWSEIAGGLVVVGLGRTVAELLRELGPVDGLEPWVEG
jgi:2-amino-4-hydroxy-6-hydroxymethyldihydropteridine diphosphokinase